MESYEQARDRQRDAAAQRVSARTEARLGNEADAGRARRARAGGHGGADRQAARPAEPLRDGDVPPPTVLTAPPEAIMREAVERVEAGQERETAAEPAKLLEKIILTADFVGVRYLDAGVVAARAVGPRQHRRRRAQPRRVRHRLARLGVAAADEPPRAAGRGHRAQQLHRVQLPGRRRRQGAGHADLRVRPRPLLPGRRRARLRARRGHATPEQLAPLRLQPADRGGGQGDHRRVRDDRAAPPRREEADRAAREQDRRHARPLHALRGRHRARLVRLAGVQRPVGGRRAAPRQRRGARARRAGRVPQRGDPGEPDHAVRQGQALRRRCARSPTRCSPPRGGARRARRPARAAAAAPVVAARAAAGAGRRGDDHRAGRDHGARRRRRRRGRRPAQGVETEAVSIDPDYSDRKGYDAAFLAQPCRCRCPARRSTGRPRASCATTTSAWSCTASARSRCSPP